MSKRAITSLSLIAVLIAAVGITLWRPAALLRLGLFRPLVVTAEPDDGQHPQVLGTKTKKGRIASGQSTTASSFRLFTRVFSRKRKPAPPPTTNTNTSTNTNTATPSNSNTNAPRNTNTAPTVNTNTAPVVNTNTSTNTNTPPPPVNPPPTLASFTDTFSTNTSVQETGSINESSNTNWWVNSGAWMQATGGFGQTLQGNLPALDPWRLDYGLSNPDDTENGYQPQNIFRLVQRGQWTNFTQEAFFRIQKMNFSSSPNRNASNGMLLFNRYVNGDNLYYTGIRVDGAAVIKKKINGTYYTMAYKQVFPGPTYNRDSVPNILPLNTWIGLRSVLKTNTDGTVTVELWLDNGRTGTWTLAVSSVDNNSSFGGKAITSSGNAGIRTDFMDVQFDDYSIRSTS